MKKRILTSCLLGLTLAVGGCASSLTGDTYSRSEARAPQTVRMGTVESVRLVQIEGTKTNIGTGAGAVIGGVAGSSVGGGRGSIRDYRARRWRPDPGLCPGSGQKRVICSGGAGPHPDRERGIPGQQVEVTAGPA